MSNRNRTAKGTTMVDKKLAKAREQIRNLEERLQSTSMGLLNMRQMYEGVVQEKQGIQAQLARTTQILVGLVIQGRGDSATLRKKTFEKLQDYTGYDTEAVDGDLIVTAITRDQFEQMMEDLEEEERDEE